MHQHFQSRQGGGRGGVENRMPAAMPAPRNHQPANTLKQRLGCLASVRTLRCSSPIGRNPSSAIRAGADVVPQGVWRHPVAGDLLALSTLGTGQLWLCFRESIIQHFIAASAIVGRQMAPLRGLRLQTTNTEVPRHPRSTQAQKCARSRDRHGRQGRLFVAFTGSIIEQK